MWPPSRHGEDDKKTDNNNKIKIGRGGVRKK